MSDAASDVSGIGPERRRWGERLHVDDSGNPEICRVTVRVEWRG